MAKIGNLASYENFITPDTRDILLYEYISDTTFDVKCYEYCVTEHKCHEGFYLVYIGNVEADGRRKLYYARPREDQWAYNHQYSQALGGDVGTYQRSYVIPREGHEEFRDALSYCDKDPELANDADTYPEDDGYEFRGVEVRRLNQELDACYVNVVRTFSKVRVEKSYPTPLEVDVIFSEYHPSCYADTQSYGDAHPDVATYPSHTLVFKSTVDPTGGVKLYYAADRDNQHKYNFTYKGAGALTSGRYDYYQRLFVVERCSLVPEDDYSKAGDVDPDAADTFKCDDSTEMFDSANFVFVGQEQSRSNVKELDSKYVFIVKTYAKLCPITRDRWDVESESMFTETITLVPKKDNPQSVDINEDGEVVEARDLNCNWVELVNRKVVDVDLEKSWNTYVDYTWPAVLENFEFMTWTKLTGEEFTVPRPIWKRRAQNIPTLATITVTYSDIPLGVADLPIPNSMLPTTIQYTCPAYRINWPASLHPQVNLVCDYGNANPVWNATVGSTRSFPATELTDGTVVTDWPETLTISSKQEPYKGGYRQTVIQITRPTED